MVLALMAAGATTGVVALAQVDQRSPVLVAASDLSAGHVLTPEDVRVVELAGAEGLSTVSDPAQVVGSVLALPVAEGGLLSQEIVGADGSQLAANEVAISAQLGPGRVPSSVRTGSQVVVVITGDDEGDISYPAVVQTLTAAETGNGTLVDLVVDASHATILARAAAEEQIALVHTPSGSEG
ncbi:MULTISPECIES: SAF domain-containing protein [Nocardiopsis]|uniref:SAF domain-containing protein n=1 Tax=Nocardiopsis tropica TaxID=109330 RepID=A0ABU7KQP9_9ACTN|nr:MULTISPECIES: SAF domain-containing protein [Nocardiopsis]MEE2051631.1 SAF domain-containing protein [Nocardiopsis umidischolae]